MLPGKHYTPFEYAFMVWRRRWILVVPMTIGLYAALIYCSRLPSIYQAEMLIQIVPQQVPDAYVRSTVTMRTEERISSLTDQIMSRSELERLIVDMNLYPAARQHLPMQDVVEEMRRQVEIEPVVSRNRPEPDSFHVRFSYETPEVAAKVTERLGALFIAVNARDRGNLAAATSNFLETQLAEARRLLEAQELKLKNFREQNAGRLPSQLPFNMQAMQNAQMQGQALAESLARDRDRKLMLERMYADAEAELNSRPPVLPQTGQPPQPGAAVPATGGAKQQLAMAREALRIYELRLKPEHPDVLRTKRMIAELEQRVAKEESAGPAAVESLAAIAPVTQEQITRRERLQQMRTELESLQRQIAYKEDQAQRIRDDVAGLERKMEQVPGVESEWVSLTRDYDTQQSAYRELLTKSTAAKLASDLELRQVGEQFRVVDPPGVPLRPAGVNRLRVNILGASAGLGVGFLISLLLEYRDRSFQSVDDVLQVIDLPVLASLPRVISVEELRRARRRRLLFSAVASMAIVAGAYMFWVLKLWKQVA